jgi:hypothetical protein
VTDGGGQADFGSFGLSMGANARFIVFTSAATNLVAGDTNGRDDVFVRDTCLGAAAGCLPATTRASVASDGSQADSGGPPLAASANGRFVAFSSVAGNLVPGDTNLLFDVFVRDMCLRVASGCTPVTRRVSVSAGGAQGDGNSGTFGVMSISADGRFIAFTSEASTLVPGDTNGVADVFLAPTGF